MFSVYKTRIRYKETNTFSPILLIFNLEIKRSNDIFKNSTKNYFGKQQQQQQQQQKNWGIGRT